MNHSKSDCRQDDGITVGLIDTIINSARLLKNRRMSDESIKEALKDLQSDENVSWLLSLTIE